MSAGNRLSSPDTVALHNILRFFSKRAALALSAPLHQWNSKGKKTHQKGGGTTMQGYIESQDIPVPLGEWAGTAGQMMKINVLHGYNALKDSYCPRSQTTPEAFDAMLQAAAAEWEHNHASYLFHAAYGRRGEQ